MNRSIARATALACVFAVLPLAAYAQAVTTPAVTSAVPLAPWVAYGQTFLTALVDAVIAAAVPILAIKLMSKWNVDIDQGHRDALQTALTNAAGSLIAEGATTIAGRSVDVHSPALAAAVNRVAAAVPDALDHFGLGGVKGADLVAEKIVAKIPQLQAPATPVATPSP